MTFVMHAVLHVSDLEKLKTGSFFHSAAYDHIVNTLVNPFLQPQLCSPRIKGLAFLSFFLKHREQF